MILKVPGEFQMTPGVCAWCGGSVEHWVAATRGCDPCTDRWLALPLDERKATTPREYFAKVKSET